MSLNYETERVNIIGKSAAEVRLFPIYFLSNDVFISVLSILKFKTSGRTKFMKMYYTLKMSL